MRLLNRRLMWTLLACLLIPRAAESARSPLAVFEEFTKFFDERYAFFELRGVDWQHQKDIYRPKVSTSTSDDELYSVLCQMIDPLDDHHTSVKRGQSTCFSDDWLPWHARSEEIQSFVHRKYLGSPATRSGAISYGMLNDSTGYIDVHHMGCKSGTEMDTALAAMKQVKKIVLDLRFNRGGYDDCALGLASRFTDRKRLVASKETYHKGNFGKRRDIYFNPKGQVNINVKLVVLTTRETISAGETFVMAMMTLPQATILGESTGGFHSDIWFKKLSNGWTVGLSAERYILPDGKIYEKVGLPPNIFMSFPGDVIEQGRDDVLERALAL